VTGAALPADAWPDHSTYGWRARIGLIVPPTNTANEADWSQVLPDGVTLHSTRMPLHVEEPLTDEDPLARDLVDASALLAQAGVAAIAYGCTAGSMIEPLDRLPALIQRTTGIPGTTTAKALVDALHALDVKRIAMISPYGETLQAREVAFLERRSRHSDRHQQSSATVGYIARRERERADYRVGPPTRWNVSTAR
jgi:maleate cis-trans isomerase